MKKLCFALALLLLALTCACGSETASAIPETKPAPESSRSFYSSIYQSELPELPPEYSPEAPLMCYAETREDAESIAEAYGITLVKYSYHIASFYTDEEPSEVIERGRAAGLPELELNRVSRPAAD